VTWRAVLLTLTTEAVLLVVSSCNVSLTLYIEALLYWIIYRAPSLALPTLDVLLEKISSCPSSPPIHLI